MPGVELGGDCRKVEGKIGDGRLINSRGVGNSGRYPPHITGVLVPQTPSELSRVANFNLESLAEGSSRNGNVSS